MDWRLPAFMRPSTVSAFDAALDAWASFRATECAMLCVQRTEHLTCCYTLAAKYAGKSDVAIVCFRSARR